MRSHFGNRFESLIESLHRTCSSYCGRGWNIRVVGLSTNPVSRSSLSLHPTKPRSLISSLFVRQQLSPNIPDTHLGSPPPKPSLFLNPLPSPNPFADPLLFPSFPSLPMMPAPQPADEPPHAAAGPFCTSSSKSKSRQAGSRLGWVACRMPKAACWSGTTLSWSSGFGGW